MSKIEIIDNFLNEDDYEELRKFLMSPRSQWRFVDFIAHKDGRDNDKDGYFVHSFTDRDPNTFKERFLRFIALKYSFEAQFTKVSVPIFFAC